MCGLLPVFWRKGRFASRSWTGQNGCLFAIDSNQAKVTALVQEIASKSRLLGEVAQLILSQRTASERPSAEFISNFMSERIRW